MPRCWRSGLNEPRAPTCRQGERAEVDAVNAEPVELLERGEFPGDAFDEVRESLGPSVVSAMGRMSISTDMIASVGSWSSRKVPRIDWEPTTITSGLPVIWHAVRMACSSWSRRIGPSLSECGLPLILGEQPAHGRYLAHLDGVAVEAGQDTVQAEHVAVPDKATPSDRDCG